MVEQNNIVNSQTIGSNELDKIVTKLHSCSDPRKKYEYLLFLAKNFPIEPMDSFKKEDKVQGCISQVYIMVELINGKLFWKGFSDALITKGMLALLIKGLNNLTPKAVLEIDPNFILSTGLNKSLTSSRANGFMNIFLKMKKQALSYL